MSILNRPSDGQLSVLLALRATLLAYGPQSSERLLQLCAPESAALGDRNMAKNTLRRWTQLGLFVADDETVKLAPSFRSIAVSDRSAFRAALLRLVLSEENNASLGAESTAEDAGQAERSRATDFSLAAAWILAQDPYGFTSSWRGAEALQNSQMQQNIIANDTRWAGLVEWASFLGVASYHAKVGLVLNPAFAISAVLDEVFQKTKELTEVVFLSRLAQVLPILDRGRYRKWVETLMPNAGRVFGDSSVSPALSVALETLSEQRLLRLESRSDAPQQRVLLGRGGRERRAVSHVVRTEVS